MPINQITLNRVKIIAGPLALAIVVGLVNGCATKSYDRGAETSTTMLSSAAQSAALSSGITTSIDALSALEYQSQGDLRQRYVKFSTSVKQLERVYHHLNNDLAKAQSQAKAYLNKWGQRSSGIRSRRIRAISNQQRQDISNKLSSVDEDYADLKTAFRPFIRDLTGVKAYLGTDLTASGLQAITNVVRKTKADSVPLRESLQTLQGHLASLATAMSPIVTAGTQ